MAQTGPGKGVRTSRATTGPPTSRAAQRGGQHAARNPGTWRGGSPPPTPTRHRLRHRTKPCCRAAGPTPAQGNHKACFSLPSSAFLVPESTALLGPSVARAFSDGHRRANRNLQESGCEMAAIAARQGAGPALCACAASWGRAGVAQAAVREGRGCGYVAAVSFWSPGEMGLPMAPAVPA